MKAVVVNETGDAAKLTISNDAKVAELGPSDCLIRNQFSGLNFIDTYHRSGK
jgi:NADPH2:quinone reductase